MGHRRRVTCTSRRRRMQGPCPARPSCSCSCSKIRSRNKKNLAYLYMRMRRRIGGDMPPRYPLRTWTALARGATSPPPLAARVLHRIDRHASHACLTRARSRTYWTCTVGHGQGPCACMGLQRATAGHSGVVCLSLHRWPATYRFLVALPAAHRPSDMPLSIFDIHASSQPLAHV